MDGKTSFGPKWIEKAVVPAPTKRQEAPITLFMALEIEPMIKSLNTRDSEAPGRRDWILMNDSVYDHNVRSG